MSSTPTRWVLTQTWSDVFQLRELTEALEKVLDANVKPSTALVIVEEAQVIVGRLVDRLEGLRGSGG